MLAEAAVVVVVLFIGWYVNFRPRSRNQLRPSYQNHHSTVSLPTGDYVIIGGGVAGLAAAAELLRCTDDQCHIILIEKGVDPQPASLAALLLEVGRRDRLLSFAPDLVRVPLEAWVKGVNPTFLSGTPDEGFLAQRPWHPPQSDETLLMGSKGNRYSLLQYAPYPRGVGLGGTAQLDWGMHVNSIWPGMADEAPAAKSASCRTTTSCSVLLPQWTRLPVRFPAVRNPLSWAFAEAVKRVKMAAPYLPTISLPVKCGAVFPSYLYIDEDGRRLALPSAVLGDIAPDVLHRRLSVLTGHTVVDVDVETQDSGDAKELGARVAGVQVRPSRGSAAEGVSIPVRKGIVVAAGALHTPYLLHRVAKHPSLRMLKSPPSTVPVRDALALPLIFSAVPAVSADSFNLRDAKSTAMWWLTQRGPYLTPLCDTLLSLPLPQISPQAELRVVLFPFGGRDAARFKGMGWDTVLGTPLEAFTMLLILHGLDGLEHTLALDTVASPPGAAHVRTLCAHHAVCALPEEVHRQVQNAFLVGIKECRRLTETPPLMNLTRERGVESTDFTLLVDSDKAKAVRFAQLSRLPPSKRSAAGKAELKDLREWSHRVTATESYMRRYVDAHTYWLGFASGSSETFLVPSSSSSYASRVAGLQNMFVGDSSAVTTAQWSDVGKRDTLAAGSRSTCMDAAARAVMELVESCGAV